MYIQLDTVIYDNEDLMQIIIVREGDNNARMKTPHEASHRRQHDDNFQGFAEITKMVLSAIAKAEHGWSFYILLRPCFISEYRIFTIQQRMNSQEFFPFRPTSLRPPRIHYCSSLFYTDYNN